MAGFRMLTAGLWQVKVCGIEEGPTGTIQTTFIANEVNSVNHLYSVFVVRHQFDDLLICLLVFRDVELRKNQNLIGLQPIDVSPTVLVRSGCSETELMYVREMSTQDASEPC